MAYHRDISEVPSHFQYYNSDFINETNPDPEVEAGLKEEIKKVRQKNICETECQLYFRRNASGGVFPNNATSPRYPKIHLKTAPKSNRYLKIYVKITAPKSVSVLLFQIEIFRKNTIFVYRYIKTLFLGMF